MARSPFEIEKLLRITKENDTTDFIDIIFGSGVPVGTSGETADAPVGSMYRNTANGKVYDKLVDTNQASDWAENGTGSANIGTFRPEYVGFTTNDVLVAGNIDPTTLSDNESGIDDTDLAVGQYVVGDNDGTPALWEITAISSPNITLAAASDPLAEGDTFICKYYLPDSPASQEGQAIIHKTSTVMIKLGDVNWDLADGINLPPGYTAVNGVITPADTVNSALEKLDGNQQDIQSTLGVAQGSINMGTFSAPANLILAASQTVKQLFQRLGDLWAGLRGTTTVGVTTSTVVDSVSATNVRAIKWFVVAWETATPANCAAAEVYALSDATSDTDDSVYARLRKGSNIQLGIDVDYTGGNMELSVSANASSTVIVRRIEVVQTVL